MKRSFDASGPMIASRSVRSITIDTQILIDLLESVATRERFAVWLPTVADCLVMPCAAFSEAVPAGRAVERIRELAMLVDDLSDSILLLDHRRMIQDELTSCPITITDYASMDLERLKLATSRSSEEILAEWGSAIDAIGVQTASRKDALFEADRALSAAVRKANEIDRTTPGTIASILKDGRATVRDFWLLREEIASAGGSKWAASDVLRRPNRFPVLSTWVEFAWRQMLANIYPVETYDAAERVAVEPWRTRRKNAGGKGEWYDNVIAATAAPTDFLLTRDSKLRKKCEVLVASGLAPVRAVAPPSFLCAS